MTNYEKFKSMSPYELANFIINNYRCERCAYNHKCCDGDCFMGISEWLESEAEPTYCTDKKNKLVHCEDCHERECKV